VKKRNHEEVLLQGNEAVAEGALRAGCLFFAGYPITPATEISEILSVRLPARKGTFIQMEDEIASMGAIIGASLAGVKSMTATSGPGFSLMQENIGFAVMAEVPCVVVDVMRGGPSTGLPTLPSQGDVMQARWGTHGDHPIIVLAPSTVRECFDFTSAPSISPKGSGIRLSCSSTKSWPTCGKKWSFPEKMEWRLSTGRSRRCRPNGISPMKIRRAGCPPWQISATATATT